MTNINSRWTYRESYGTHLVRS